MCPRSPGVHRTALDTAIAGTETEQLIVGVYAGAMPITPLDPQTIGSYQCDGGRANVRGDSAGVEQGTTRHLFDTPGTGTRQPKLPGREECFVSRGLPLDQESIVTAGNAMGSWNGHWLLAIGHR
jgi:hypothetical protein